MSNLVTNEVPSMRDYVVNSPGIFAFIKNLVDEILPPCDDKILESDFLVDIEGIARKFGVTDIQRIAPVVYTENEETSFKHAILLGTVIFLNDSDNKEKQRFSIAHEIFHFITRPENDRGLKAVARHGEAWKKEHTGKLGFSQKVYTEELADYFAANLLVPTERFILLEDRSIEEIAQVFGVEPRCIEKRKNEEIEKELSHLAPESITADALGEVKEEAPLSLDELDIILKGHCHNEGQT